MRLGLGLNLGKQAFAPGGGGSLLDGLVAWYRNNGTDSSNGNNLAATGAPGTGAGIDGTPGAAMTCPADAYYGGEPQVTVFGTGLSLSAWLYVDHDQLFADFKAVYDEFIDNEILNPNEITITMRPGLFQDAGGCAVVATCVLSGITSGPGEAHSLEIGANVGEDLSPPLGSNLASGWHHAVVVWDAALTRVRGYLNGVCVFENVGYDPNVSGEFLFARVGWTTEDGASLGSLLSTGLVREQFTAVYGRVLTDGGVSVGNPAAPSSDIARLYNGGAGFDPTA